MKFPFSFLDLWLEDIHIFQTLFNAPMINEQKLKELCNDILLIFFIKMLLLRLQVLLE